ncbi:hypothetical protein BC938DRAFT_479109 [Jimgerdemannia flammicorona]|uniref:Uncharacterized protein n=1 Tax=Jimgerdemannia flammicorona TaxID=994334 RepID=A0A433QLL4_9FUNG|nr:hypothetical protein BC938DRAFT_479109 [Jimgerdemannia flammicorona]
MEGKEKKPPPFRSPIPKLSEFAPPPPTTPRRPSTSSPSTFRPSKAVPSMYQFYPRLPLHYKSDRSLPDHLGRKPIFNPFDIQTGEEFDEWVGSLRTKIADALTPPQKTQPQHTTQSWLNRRSPSIVVDREDEADVVATAANENGAEHENEVEQENGTEHDAEWTTNANDMNDGQLFLPNPEHSVGVPLQTSLPYGNAATASYSLSSNDWYKFGHPMRPEDLDESIQDRWQTNLDMEERVEKDVEDVFEGVEDAFEGGIEGEGGVEDVFEEDVFEEGVEDMLEEGVEDVSEGVEDVSEGAEDVLEEGVEDVLEEDVEDVSEGGVEEGGVEEGGVEVEGVLERGVEGVLEGGIEGVLEGVEDVLEGSVEDVLEGDVEGVLEGAAEGVSEGPVKGVLEGTVEGVSAGAVEGVSAGAVEGVLEGDIEGVLEGAVERVLEEAVEGVLEGDVEDVLEGDVVDESLARPQYRVPASSKPLTSTADVIDRAESDNVDDNGTLALEKEVDQYDFVDNRSAGEDLEDDEKEETTLELSRLDSLQSSHTESFHSLVTDENYSQPFERHGPVDLMPSPRQITVVDDGEELEWDVAGDDVPMEDMAIAYDEKHHNDEEDEDEVSSGGPSHDMARLSSAPMILELLSSDDEAEHGNSIFEGDGTTSELVDLAATGDLTGSTTTSISTAVLEPAFNSPETSSPISAEATHVTPISTLDTIPALFSLTRSTPAFSTSPSTSVHFNWGSPPQGFGGLLVEAPTARETDAAADTGSDNPATQEEAMSIFDVLPEVHTSDAEPSTPPPVHTKYNGSPASYNAMAFVGRSESDVNLEEMARRDETEMVNISHGNDESVVVEELKVESGTMECMEIFTRRSQSPPPLSMLTSTSAAADETHVVPKHEIAADVSRNGRREDDSSLMPESEYAHDQLLEPYVPSHTLSTPLDARHDSKLAPRSPRPPRGMVAAHVRKFEKVAAASSAGLDLAASAQQQQLRRSARRAAPADDEEEDGSRRYGLRARDVKKIASVAPRTLKRKASRAPKVVDEEQLSNRDKGTAPSPSKAASRSSKATSKATSEEMLVEEDGSGVPTRSYSLRHRYVKKHEPEIAGPSRKRMKRVRLLESAEGRVPKDFGGPNEKMSELMQSGSGESVVGPNVMGEDGDFASENDGNNSSSNGNAREHRQRRTRVRKSSPVNTGKGKVATKGPVNPTDDSSQHFDHDHYDEHFDHDDIRAFLRDHDCSTHAEVDAVVDDPAADDAAVGDAAVDDAAVDDAAVGDTAIDDTAIDDTAIDDTAIDDTAIDDTAVGDVAQASSAVHTDTEQRRKIRLQIRSIYNLRSKCPMREFILKRFASKERYWTKSCLIEGPSTSPPRPRRRRRDEDVGTPSEGGQAREELVAMAGIVATTTVGDVDTVATATATADDDVPKELDRVRPDVLRGAKRVKYSPMEEEAEMDEEGEDGDGDRVGGNENSGVEGEGNG